MGSFTFTTKSKAYKRDSCAASVVSLSSQVSLSSKSSRSSIASSLAQAKQATSAAWGSVKKGTAAALRTCRASCKTPSSPRPRSSLDNPFNDYTYRVADSGRETSRAGRLMVRLGRRTRYAALADSRSRSRSRSHQHDNDDDNYDDECDIFSGQPFWAGREAAMHSGAGGAMASVVVSTRPPGACYAAKTPYARFDEDEDEW